MIVVRLRGRRLAGIVLAGGLSVLLTACGGGADVGGADGDTGGEDVASLATDPVPVDDASETPERPLIRSDTSPEEEERLWDEYQRCLEEHGAPAATGESGQGEVGEPVGGVVEDEDRILAAEAACEHKLPEQLWQRAQRTDPDYEDKLRDWVTCIRSHGIDVWESDGFLTFHSLPPEHEMVKVAECEEKAFASD